jgi:hypothetical protein
MTNEDAVSDHLTLLKLNGWCALENIIPAQEVENIRNSVLQTVEEYRRDSAAENIGFVPGLISQNQSFAPYLADSRLMSLLDEMLGHDIRISFTSAIVNEPDNERGHWHADWPFNQSNAGHVPAPYPDALFHITTLWMLSPFSDENGGTLIVPGSHRSNNNPTGNNGIDAHANVPGEMNATGSAGSVLVMDSRLWHATAPNHTNEPRVALAIRYAPWWLNLDILMPESAERKHMVDRQNRKENEVPHVPQMVYDQLPEDVKPLYRHWVR